MYFNEDGEQYTPIHSSSITNNNISFDDKRLNTVDVISVGKQSRLTLTKNTKKLIPLNPGDKITVCQDIYSKEIILKVQPHQHQDKKASDKWIVTIRKEGIIKKPSGNGNGVSIRNSDGNNSHQDKQDNINRVKTGSNKKTEAASMDRYGLQRKDTNTLYSIPILLVDDEPDLIMSFDYLLKSEGYNNVKTFSSSKSVLKHLLESKSMLHYKLAIMDIRMPDINGIQLYQILRILNPSIKTMFLTALDAVNELMSLYPEIRPTDILRKPVENNQFVGAVNDKVSSLVTSAY